MGVGAFTFAMKVGKLRSSRAIADWSAASSSGKPIFFANDPAFEIAVPAFETAAALPPAFEVAADLPPLDDPSRRARGGGGISKNVLVIARRENNILFYFTKNAVQHVSVLVQFTFYPLHSLHLAHAV